MDDRMETYLTLWQVLILHCFFYINSISLQNESWQSLREVLEEVGITGIMNSKALHNYGTME